MKDFQKMMREAQKMAAEMQKAQESLAELEMEGSAGGGSVKAVVTGDMHIQRITLSPDLFDTEIATDDLEMIADVVVAAVNDALNKVREAQAEAMGPLAGGLGGMGLPGG